MSDTSWYEGHLDANSIQDNIEDFCNAVDSKIDAGELVPNNSGKWFIVVTGSSAFIMFNVSERFLTDDIDIYRYETYIEINKLFPVYDMNTEQSKFPLCFPNDYYQRCEVIQAGRYIDVYTPSWSDLVFSKLERYKHQDELDLDGLAKSGNLNWEEVESLICQEENGHVFPSGIMEKIRLNWNRFLEKHSDKHDLRIDWGEVDPYDGWDDDDGQ